MLLYLTFAISFFILFYFFSRIKSSEFIVVGVILSIYHFSLGYLNTAAAKNKTVDAISYYNWGTTTAINNFDFSIGSAFIVHLVNWLNPVFPSFELMSAFFCGLTLLVFLKLMEFIYRAKMIKSINNKEFFLLLLFLFVPGFHYWTVSLGKDSLILLAIFLGILSIYKKNIFIFLVSCILMLFVRIHIFALFFICLFISEFFYCQFNFLRLKGIIYKSLLLLISFPFTIGMFVFLFNYIQRYSSEGFSNIDEFLEGRAEVYADLGSGAWLSVQPYPIKVFAFIFGGVPWLSIDVLTIFSMLEGLIIFFLSCTFFMSLKQNFSTYDLNYKALMTFMSLFIIILILFFALTNNNLGVMVRMKVMIYSPLIFLGIIAFSKKNTLRG